MLRVLPGALSRQALAASGFAHSATHGVVRAAKSAPTSTESAVHALRSTSAPTARVFTRFLSLQSNNVQEGRLMTALKDWGVGPDMSKLAVQRLSMLNSQLSDLGLTVNTVTIKETAQSRPSSNTENRQIEFYLDALDRENGIPVAIKSDKSGKSDSSDDFQSSNIVKRVLRYDVTNDEDGRTAQVVRVMRPSEDSVTKGGIRVIPFSSDKLLSEAELEAGADELSLGMDEKIICVGLDKSGAMGLDFKLAGGKSEVGMPEEWQGTDKKGELFRAKGMIAGFTLPLGLIDTPAPDMLSGPEEMDSYASGLKDIGVACPGFWITGKGKEGHPSRPQATGEGVAEVLRQMLKMEGSPISMQGSDTQQKAKIAVQGAGNVGLHVMHSLLENDAADIVAISDMFGAIKVESGIDATNLQDAINVVKGKMSIDDFNNTHETKATLNASEKIWSTGANVWIPAANRNSVTMDHLTDIPKQPIMIVCGANNALTEETIKALDKVELANDVYIVPPEIANPGGVFGSALEMASSREGIQWMTEAGADRLALDKNTHRKGMRDMFVNILGNDISAVKDANGYHARNNYVQSAGAEGRLSGVKSGDGDMRGKTPASSRIDLTELM